MFSWSLPSLVLRLLIPLHRGSRLPAGWEFGNVAAGLHLAPALEMLSAGVALATLAGGIAALAIACRGRLRASQVPAAMAALISLVLVAAPVSWTHYQVLQYPGVALLLHDAVRRRSWRTAACVAICFAFCYQVPQAVLMQYHNIHSGWSTYSPFKLYLWTSISPFASLGLFGVGLAAVRRMRGRLRLTGRSPVERG